MATENAAKLAEENKFLKKQLRVRLNLVDKGDVTLLTPDTQLSQKRAADIQLLTRYPQWEAYRYWYMLNAKMLYEQAATVGKEEAYIMCRLAKCLIDLLGSAEGIMPEEEQFNSKDTFDLEGGQVSVPGKNLPLGEGTEE